MSENIRLTPPERLRRPARRRPVIVPALILCAAFAALCLLRAGWFAPKQAAETVAAPAASSFIQLVPEGSGAPTRVAIEADGERYALRADGDGYALEDSDEAVDDAMARRLLGAGASVLARAKLDGDEADFGLTEASPRATYTYEDGAALTLRFGDAPATGEGRYAAVEGREGVYVVNAALYDAVTAGRRALCLLPSLDDVFTAQTLLEATVERPGKAALTLRRVTEENPFNTVVELTAPIHYPANSERAAEVFMALDALAPEALLADGGELDALDARVTLTGQTETLALSLGALNGEAAVQFGDGKIYRLAAGSTDFIPRVTVAYLAEQLPGLVALNRVRSLELRRGEEVYRLEMTADGATLNGAALDEDGLKRLYQAAIGLLIDQYAAEGLENPVPRASFTYAFDDGSTWTLGFAAFDDASDAVLRDGESCFLIARSKVDAVFETAAALTGN